MGECGGKYRRRAVAYAVAILREEKGMLIGGIKVGRYGNINRAALDRSFCLNGGPTAVTFQVENIRGNNDTLAVTIALTEEEAEINYNKIWVEPLGLFRADAIFSDISRESDKNLATLTKKEHDMACISVIKNTVTLNAASNTI